MSVRHRMKLSPENFDKVKTGEKTFEFRLNDEKRQGLKVGENIELAKLPELETSQIVEITSLDVYKDFTDLYRQIPVTATRACEAEFIQMMRQHYTEAEEQKYGVVAIGIRLT